MQAALVITLEMWQVGESRVKTRGPCTYPESHTVNRERTIYLWLVNSEGPRWKEAGGFTASTTQLKTRPWVSAVGVASVQGWKGQNVSGARGKLCRQLVRSLRQCM